MHSDSQNRNQVHVSDYKTLFDPNNPSKPIYIQQKQQKILARNVNNDDVSKQQNVQHQDHQHHRQQQQQQHQLFSKNTTTEAKVKEIIQRIQPLENKLKKFVETCDMKKYENIVENIDSLRRNLENLCLQAVLTNIETSTKFNVDSNYWKICYHQLIEKLRKEYSNILNESNDMEHANKFKHFFENYIDEGFKFYENFIIKLEEKYNFNKNDYLDLKKFKQNLTTKTIKLALLCVNRCFICLGDLARYKESLNDMKDYYLARSYYIKAMYIAPKCSRAYNQLAILAMYTRKRLDAVYYYIRCLKLNQPLITARQSLVTLFDEARKRSEIISENINKKKHKSINSNNNNNNNKNKINSNRIELWIKSNSVDSQINNNLMNDKIKCKSDPEDDNHNGCIYNDDDDNDDNELLNMSSIELNKRFMHDYLNLIGKLFTKVGMESYPEICSRMLYEFTELLKREPCPIGKMRLLQIIIINISIIDLTKPDLNKNQGNCNNDKHNVSEKSNITDNINAFHLEQTKLEMKNVDGSNDINESVLQIVGFDKQHSIAESFSQRSQLQEFAIQLSLNMFAIIVKRLTRIFSSHVSDETNTKLRELFPAVKIFSDWMMENYNIWFPIPDQLSSHLGPNLNLSQIFSKFFNEINNIDFSGMKFHSKQTEDTSLEALILEEDREISGFSPFNNFNHEIIYVETHNYDLEILKDYRRLHKMYVFGNYLCNLKKSIIRYDIMNRSYLPFVKKSEEFSRVERDENQSTSKQEQEECLNESIHKSSDLKIYKEENDDKSLCDLIEKRKNLKAKVDENLRRDETLQTLLESTANNKIELEIRPRFLVPDTNCFIDHLNLIEILLKSNRYTIIIPLIVINELRSLAKSISNHHDDSIEHAEMVQRNAKKTIEFLNEKFEKRERNLKALTSQGSVLETIQFRSEEIKTEGSNDDLILGCCLHYCKNDVKDSMQNDCIHLLREVVLLTEDRNLTLKAHTRNVPVKNIINFCKWANMPNLKEHEQSNATKEKSQKNRKGFRNLQ